MPERKSWYVNGSHGFLGSHLVALLEQSQQEVIRGNREGLVTPVVDYIIAAQSFGNYYWQREDAVETYKANVVSIARILQNHQNKKGIIYVSSTSVLLDNQTYYSAAKKAGEEMVRVAATHGAPAISIRPSSITGVGEQKEHLIPKLIDSCLNGTEVPFVGEPTHDFIDVSDVARAIMFLAPLAEELKGEAINISSGVSTSNEEVLAIVEGLTGSRANVKRVNSLRSYDTKDWRVDNMAMISMGWEPKVTLRESIKNMVDAYGK